MKRSAAKLVLTAATVRVLADRELERASGGHGKTELCIYAESVRAGCCTKMGSGCTSAIG